MLIRIVPVAVSALMVLALASPVVASSPAGAPLAAQVESLAMPTIARRLHDQRVARDRVLSFARALGLPVRSSAAVVVAQGR